MDKCCEGLEQLPKDRYLQSGTGKGSKVLIVGESPAPNGWRKSGRAFYTVGGKLLPSGRNLNKLLVGFGLSVEMCAFTELVKCFVGKDRKLLVSCGEKYWTVFLGQLDSGGYNLVILLGVKTLKIFNKLQGSALETGQLSEIAIGNRSYNILPIYHPSPINPFNHRKNQQIFKDLENKLSQLLSLPLD